VRFHELLRKEEENLVHLLARETGKVLADARGELQRGMEVVEHALALPSLLLGESVMHGGVQLNSHLEPVGVCLGITPFNFPVMIPLWMFPLAIACGNSFVLKPSEQDPLSTMALVELTKEAGLPDGVLQVVHGGREQVEALIGHPDIAAISFVGSATVARAVYRLAGLHGKRVQALAGAKNHAVLLPDAPREETLRAIAGLAVGRPGNAAWRSPWPFWWVSRAMPWPCACARSWPSCVPAPMTILALPLGPWCPGLPGSVSEGWWPVPARKELSCCWMVAR
jgi:malonate-semialdehyde dehydrogenase (acetylating)/methylmalonate-semialdehyde dehydrogenase